jgi:hypothetical protein
MYAMILTRPDIAFTLGKLSQYMSNPCERHGKALKKLLRYLNSTITQKLRFGPGGARKRFAVYSDADWAGDKVDRKSVSGYVIMFYGGPIAWGSQRFCIRYKDGIQFVPGDIEGLALSYNKGKL